MATEDRSQRTERPTGRRLKKAKEHGQVARSPEIPGVLVLAGFLIFCRVSGSPWLGKIQAFLAESLGHLSGAEMTPTTLGAIFTSTASVTGALLAAPLGVCAAAAAAGTL